MLLTILSSRADRGRATPRPVDAGDSVELLEIDSENNTVMRPVERIRGAIIRRKKRNYNGNRTKYDNEMVKYRKTTDLTTMPRNAFSALRGIVGYYSGADLLFDLLGQAA